MSRSIHANRSKRQTTRTGGVDWQAIHMKRSVKAGVATERHTPSDALPISPALTVPILLVDDFPNLFFPPSIEDMRAVLEALPQGATNGLLQIRLEVGKRIVNDSSRAFDMVDPYFGRYSSEEVVGVFLPMTLGVYLQRQQTIRIFGYAKPARKTLTPRQQILLELRMLQTLVHEVIHHHDWTHRMGSGRSSHNYCEHSETYTQRLTVKWVISAVLPHLKQKHGEADTLRLTRLVLRPKGEKRLRLGVSRGERKRRAAALRATMAPGKWRWLMTHP